MALGDPFSGIGVGMSHVSDAWKYINSQETMNAAMAQQAQQGQWAQAQQGPPPLSSELMRRMVADGQAPATPKGMTTRAHELFINRMKGVRDTGFTLKPTDFVACHIFEERVYLFFMLNGKEGVVSEQIDGFPSDQLIAQFRMVLA